MLNFTHNDRNYFIPVSYTEVIWSDYIQIYPLLTNTGSTFKDRVFILSVMSKCPKEELIKVNSETIETLYSYLMFLYEDIPIISVENDLITLENQWFYIKTDLLKDKTISAEEVYFLHEYVNSGVIDNLPKIFSILCRKIVKKPEIFIKKHLFRQKFTFEIEPFSIEFSMQNAKFFEKLSVSTLYSVFFYFITTEMSYLLGSLTFLNQPTNPTVQLMKKMMFQKSQTSLTISFLPFAIQMLKNIIDLKRNHWLNYLDFWKLK